MENELKGKILLQLGDVDNDRTEEFKINSSLAWGLRAFLLNLEDLKLVERITKE